MSQVCGKRAANEPTRKSSTIFTLAIPLAIPLERMSKPKCVQQCVHSVRVVCMMDDVKRLHALLKPNFSSKKPARQDSMLGPNALQSEQHEQHYLDVEPPQRKRSWKPVALRHREEMRYAQEPQLGQVPQLHSGTTRLYWNRITNELDPRTCTDDLTATPPRSIPVREYNAMADCGAIKAKKTNTTSRKQPHV